MGLFLMMSGLGNYVSEAILKIVRAATGTEPPGNTFTHHITNYSMWMINWLRFINKYSEIVIDWLLNNTK